MEQAILPVTSEDTVVIIFYSLEASHYTHREEIKFYFLKGGVSKNFWMHFNGGTPSDVKVLRAIVGHRWTVGEESSQTL